MEGFHVRVPFTSHSGLGKRCRSLSRRPALPLAEHEKNVFPSQKSTPQGPSRPMSISYLNT